MVYFLVPHVFIFSAVAPAFIKIFQTKANKCDHSCWVCGMDFWCELITVVCVPNFIYTSYMTWRRMWKCPSLSDNHSVLYHLHLSFNQSVYLVNVKHFTKCSGSCAIFLCGVLSRKWLKFINTIHTRWTLCYLYRRNIRNCSTGNFQPCLNVLLVRRP